MTEKQKRKQAAAQAQRISKVKHDRKHILSQNSGFYLREAYRALRTNVNFALADKEGSKVIMVTSSLQGEGKSLTALNLSIALGQMDKKVLLVDCDLRRPRMARLLNITAPAGLSNLIMDFTLLDMAVVNSEDHGIDLILSGDIPPNPAELLASNRMQKLVELMRGRYDYIILDSPPVDLVVDAVALSSQCDGVLFVVRADQSERGAVIHGMEQLEYAGANILGFVFNGVTAETASGYGKYRFRKYARNNRGYNKFYRYGYRGYGYGNYSYRNAPNDIPREQPVSEKQR
ncbi:MAG: CpsD/CapB family tyrosine-protein kinase [Ruminococcaceae bacterium]|nr:CpsD/CapB family tyrosine-protein kinase [Oscillospiraceae bacterium]